MPTSNFWRHGGEKLVYSGHYLQISTVVKAKFGIITNALKENEVNDGSQSMELFTPTASLVQPVPPSTSTSLIWYEMTGKEDILNYECENVHFSVQNSTDKYTLLPEFQMKYSSDSGFWLNSTREKRDILPGYHGLAQARSALISFNNDEHSEVKKNLDVLAAVMYLTNTYLDACSLTIFSEQDTSPMAQKMRKNLSIRPVKMFDLKSDVLKSVETWSKSMCDGYLLFMKKAKEFIHHANISHYHESIQDDNPQSLWNYYAHYVVILPRSSKSSLLPWDILSLYNFQKTTKVVVLQPKDDYVLFWSNRLYLEGSGIRLVGTWKNGKFTNSEGFFSSNLDNFYGTTLSVATFDHPPSVVYAYDRNQNIISRLGVDMQIVQTLAQARNFTPDFIEVNHDELWGYEQPNGTWNGLVGKVFYEYADIGVCNVFLELHRWKMVDYSVPYNFERGCFVAPSPKPLLSWTSPFMPFAKDTWISIAIFLAAGGLLLYIITFLSKNAEPKEFLSISYDYLYILGSVTMKAFWVEPKYMPVRLYMGFTWMFGLIISTAYSANLIAFLSVTQFTAPIDTMKDLSTSGLRIGGVAFWKTQFTASIDPVVQNFVNKLETDVDLKSLFDSVEAGEFALIENKQYLELQVGARYTYGSKTTLRIVPDCLLPYSIGLAFQKNSPLKAVFDSVILQLFESGVVQKWKDEVVTYFRQQFKAKRSMNAEEDVGMNHPLSLKQLQGVFYLLGIGYLLAGFILVIEFIIFNQRNQAEVKPY